MIDFAKLVLSADTTDMKSAKNDLDQLGKAGAQTERATSSLTTAVRRATLAIGALSVGFGFAARAFVTATSETAKVQSQLAAVIQSTGAVAGRSIDQLNDTAAALQNMTTFGDEAINSMQSLLLTFTNVAGPQFDRATEAILDMSTALGQDLSSSAMQVGKALNDPIRGMTMLGRAGVQFSEAQKDAIKSLVEMGDVAGAQTVILAELERQFGGSAVAARETLGGALASLGNAWGDLFELSGGASEDLRLSIEALIATIRDPAFVQGFQDIGSTIFTVMDTALKSVLGLQMIMQDVGFLLGFNEQTVAMERASRLAAEAVDKNLAAVEALTASIPRGVEVSRDMIEAKLDEAEAHLAVVRAMQSEQAQLVAQDPAYISAVENVTSLRSEVDRLAERLEEMKAENSELGFELFDVTSVSGQLVGLRIELMKAEEAAKAIYDRSSAISPEFLAAQAEVARLRGELTSASGEMIVLENATTNAAVSATELSARLSSMSMGGQAAGQAAILAQQLGVALNVAVRLNQALDRNAGTTPASAGPRLGFGGLGSTLDNPLSTGMANATLGFGDLSDAVDKTWREVEDLTVGVGDLAVATGGSSGGSAVSAADDLRKAYDQLIGSLDPSIARTQQFAEDQKLLSDALAAGVITAEEYASALEMSRQRNQVEGGNDYLSMMKSAVGELSSAFEKFIGSGLKDLDGLFDSFKRILLKMITTAATNQIKLSLGFTGDGVSPAGGIGGGIQSALGGLGSSFMGGAQSFLSGGFGAIGPALSGATGSLAGFATALGAVALPVAAVATVIAAFRKKTEELNAGLRITIDGTDALVEQFRTVRESRLFGLISETNTDQTRASSDIANPIKDAYDEIYSGVTELAGALNISASQFDDFATKIVISTKGMTEDEAAAAVEKAFAGLSDELAQLALRGRDVIRDGESATDALTRLTTSLATVNGAFDVLGFDLYRVSVRGSDAASSFAELFGSLDEFAQATEFYYQNFYTLGQRTRGAARQFAQGLEDLGVKTVPETIKQFRQLVNTLMDQGRTEDAAGLIQLAPLFQSLMDLQDQFDDTTDVVDDATGAIDNNNSAQDRAERRAQARAEREERRRIRAERMSLQEELWQLTGQTEKLRRRELRGLDETNRALRIRIWSIRDEREELRKEREERRRIREEARDVRDERRGLQDTLWDLLGREDLIRQRTLNGLDETNQAIQIRIWALEDEKEATEKATAAIDELLSTIQPEQFATRFDYERALGRAANMGAAPMASPAASVSVPAIANTPSSDARLVEGLLSSILGRITRVEKVLRKWDVEGQPPERA